MLRSIFQFVVRATRLKEYIGRNGIDNVNADTMQNFLKSMNRDMFEKWCTAYLAASGARVSRTASHHLGVLLRVQTAGTRQVVVLRATRLKEYMGKNRISNVNAGTMQNFFKPMNRDD